MTKLPLITGFERYYLLRRSIQVTPRRTPKLLWRRSFNPSFLTTFPFVVLSQENILKKTEKWPWKYLQDEEKNWELTLTKEVLIPIFLTYQVSVKLLWGKFWRRGVNFAFYRGAKNQLRKKNLETTMIYNCKNANDRVCAIVALFAFFSSKLGLIMCVYV